MIRTPFLIQRICREQHNTDKGSLDDCFEWDYMGSSEFEWGALPRAIFTLRAHDENKELTCMDITSRGGPDQPDYTCTFVGPVSLLHEAAATFDEDLGRSPARHRKEGTYIRKTYEGAQGYGHFVGWLALSNNGRLPSVPDMLKLKVRETKSWAIFRKREHAEMFLRCLRSRKVQDYARDVKAKADG